MSRRRGDVRKNPCPVAGTLKLAVACSRKGLRVPIIDHRVGAMQCPGCGRWVKLNHYQGPKYIQAHNRL